MKALSQQFYDIDPYLLVKYLLGEAGPEERLQTEQWIAARPANRKQFEDFKLIWETSKGLAGASTISEEDSWQRFRERIHTAPKQPAIVRPLHRRTPRLRIAAILLLAVGIGWLITNLYSNQTVSVQSLAAVLKDTLPDGSVVTLNKNATLSHPRRFTGGARNIALQGEAFFNVAPDRKKPFIIQVNDLSIRVIGTSFNVRGDKNNTEVIVETGIVQVTRGGHTVELHPQERISVAPADSMLAKKTVTDKLYNYYRSKEFICDSTPLWKLADVLQEAYGVRIIIEREELRNLLLTTTFEDASLDTILGIISKTFNINFEKQSPGVIILK